MNDKDRIRELEVALEPFSEMVSVFVDEYDWVWGDKPDDYEITINLWPYKVNLGQLRRAYKARA